MTMHLQLKKALVSRYKVSPLVDMSFCPKGCCGYHSWKNVKTSRNVTIEISWQEWLMTQESSRSPAKQTNAHLCVGLPAFS